MISDDLDILVQRVRGGDEAAFTAIVGELHGDLCAFVAVRVANPDLIEEVVNDALATAFEKLQDYRAGGTFRSWVKGIARNLALRHLHEVRRGSGETAQEVLEAALAQAALTRLADQADDDERGRLTRLHRCLEHLAPTARALLTWRYGEALPLPQVAERAGRSTAGVANLLLRLRSQLRDCIERVTP